LRILWLNWRDIKNPEHGGAEVLTHEIASRLVRKGDHKITLFAAHFPGGLTAENLDGIHIIREGGKYTVYNKAKTYYKRNKDYYDLVIDEINVKPFLTPKFVREKPILAIIHQISPEQFLYELPFPLSYIGRYYLEKKWLSYYKEMTVVTVSNSSKQDLSALGFKNIFVIPEGSGAVPLSEVPKKESTPTLIFIGRLKRHKLPDHAINAFNIIKNELPDAKMWVIGDGYMRTQLEKKLSIKDVKFCGYVSSEMKYDLLKRAHLVLMPATREGWGLVVTEANAMGTPVVGYNVPGLRDSIKDGETGILTKENSPDCLASSAVSLLKSPQLLKNFSYNALQFSKQFDWDTTYNMFDKILSQMLKNIPERDSKSIWKRHE
jgi:glycosyltransferase involved in cell wall biosynthesis